MKSLEELADRVIETDILICGGGLGGAMAALRVKEKGSIDVTVVEKAHSSCSGDGAFGMDHYPAVAHPKINGLTPEQYGRMRADDLEGLGSTKLSIITAQYAMKPIPVLEDIGVKIREEDGTFKLVAGRTSGSTISYLTHIEKGLKPSDFILYRGADLKKKLSAAMYKRGVRVLERTMLTGLLVKDGSVVGSTAVNVRTGEFIVFKSKFTILATGGMQSRLYVSYPFIPFPNNLFTHYNFVQNAGGGHVAAYRAGAKLCNLEFIHVRGATLGKDPGPQGILFCKIKNSKGEELIAKYPEVSQRTKTGAIPFSELPYAPDMSRPEIEREVLMYTWEGVPEVPPEYQGNFMAANETPFVLKALRERGGIRNGPFEMYPWLKGIVRSLGGVMHDENGETSLKRLFVTGDMVGGQALYGATGAFAWGYKIGDYLRELVPETKEPVFNGEQIEAVQAERERILSPLGRKNGVNPLELEHIVRNIMFYYVGIHKIEPKLKRCIEHLEVIRERYVPFLMARNPHELMRVLEVQDIIQMGELHAQTALLRNETRLIPAHYRVDYPERDDAHWQNKIIVVNNVGGEMKYNIETIK